jgi:uncharacterized iron-regulated membrane protein
MRKGRAPVLRLHLAVALLAGAALALVAASGAALVFRPEMDEAAFGGPVRVEPGAARAPLAALVDAGLAPHPGLAPTTLMVPADSHRPARLRLERASGEAVEVLLDPFRARVLASRWLERAPSYALHTLHTELYLGARGRLVVAALGLLLIGQAATGLFLWWPFTRRLSRGFTVRAGRPWRVVGYDLHKTIGIVSLVLNVPLAATGVLLALAAGGRPEAAAPPPVERRVAMTLDEAVRRAEAAAPGGAIVSLRFRPDAVEVRRRDGGVVRVDRAGGAVTVLRDAQRTGDRLWALVRPLHVGRFGGWAGRLLYALVGLTPAALALTGVGIWLTRPPQTGHPSRRQPMSQNIHS